MSLSLSLSVMVLQMSVIGKSNLVSSVKSVFGPRAEVNDTWNATIFSF